MITELKIDVPYSDNCSDTNQDFSLAVTRSHDDGIELFHLFDNNESRNNSHILSFPLIRIDTLGQGSSSIVYKSVTLNTLTVTAEKVFVINDPTKRQQLLREIEILQKTLHSPQLDVSDDKFQSQTPCPFVVSLLGVFSNPYDGTLSLCLEYMDAGSLQQLVEVGGCQDEIVISSIAYQMFSGLAYLHGLRLIHRDVKPSNALISSSGKVKLADFGLTKSLDSGHSLAESFVGTFMYMSPERLAGEPYSFLSDVWSLGLTIYTVVLGRYPYPAIGKKGYWELLHATQKGPPPIASDIIMSESLRAFLSAACIHDTTKRLSAVKILNHEYVSSHMDTVPDGSPRAALLKAKVAGGFAQCHQYCKNEDPFESSKPGRMLQTSKDISHEQRTHNLVSAWRSYVIESHDKFINAKENFSKNICEVESYSPICTARENKKISDSKAIKDSCSVTSQDCDAGIHCSALGIHGRIFVASSALGHSEKEESTRSKATTASAVAMRGLREILSRQQEQSKSKTSILITVQCVQELAQQLGWDQEPLIKEFQSCILDLSKRYCGGVGSVKASNFRNKAGPVPVPSDPKVAETKEIVQKNLEEPSNITQDRTDAQLEENPVSSQHSPTDKIDGMDLSTYFNTNFWGNNDYQNCVDQKGKLLLSESDPVTPPRQNRDEKYGQDQSQSSSKSVSISTSSSKKYSPQLNIQDSNSDKLLLPVERLINDDMSDGSLDSCISMSALSLRAMITGLKETDETITGLKETDETEAPSVNSFNQSNVPKGADQAHISTGIKYIAKISNGSPLMDNAVGRDAIMKTSIENASMSCNDSTIFSTLERSKSWNLLRTIAATDYPSPTQVDSVVCDEYQPFQRRTEVNESVKFSAVSTSTGSTSDSAVAVEDDAVFKLRKNSLSHGYAINSQDTFSGMSTISKGNQYYSRRHSLDSKNQRFHNDVHNVNSNMKSDNIIEVHQIQCKAQPYKKRSQRITRKLMDVAVGCNATVGDSPNAMAISHGPSHGLVTAGKHNEIYTIDSATLNNKKKRMQRSSEALIKARKEDSKEIAISQKIIQHENNYRISLIPMKGGANESQHLGIAARGHISASENKASVSNIEDRESTHSISASIVYNGCSKTDLRNGDTSSVGTEDIEEDEIIACDDTEDTSSIVSEDHFSQSVDKLPSVIAAPGSASITKELEEAENELYADDTFEEFD